MKRIMTPELTERAAELYLAGLSTYQAARKMGLHPATVRNALVAANIPIRHGREAQRENLSLRLLPWRKGTKHWWQYKHLRRKGFSRELAIERVGT